MRQKNTPPHGPAIILLATMLTILLAGPAPAHDGAKGIVKERMAAMKSIALAMKTIGPMARGKTALDGAKIAGAAGHIGEHGSRIAELFPAGSGMDAKNGGMTEASPDIWRDWDGFKNSADRMVAVARDLEKAGRANDAAAVKAAYRALGKTCGACHNQFRVKKMRH